MNDITHTDGHTSSHAAATTCGSGSAAASSARHRRRLLPDARRAELVDAAVRLLRAGVDEGNWVADVTREADAAKGTFYVYFPSWEHMLATVRDHLIEECSAPIRTALAAPGPLDYWAVLEEQCGRFIDISLAFKRHHALIFHSPLPERPVEEAQAGPALLAALIARGITEDCFGPVDAVAGGVLLFAAVHAAADAVLAGGDRDRWITASMALARGYLSPQPALAPRSGRPANRRRIVR